MAKPQAENGHVDIANGIAEALCRINLTAYEGRVLWALFRKTYGWHKKWDHISYTQWEEITGIKRWHIARTIKLLIERNIITQRGNGYKIEYSFQKDYEQWKMVSHRHDLLPREVTEEQALPRGEEALPRGEEALPRGVTKALPNGVNTKEKKETIQKKRQKKEDLSQNFQIFWIAYPKKVAKANAEKAFAKINPDEQLLKTMLTSIKRAKKSEGWLKDDGKFIPHPTTWLNGRRWEDEIKEAGHGTHIRGDKQVPGNQPAGAFDDLEKTDDAV